MKKVLELKTLLGFPAQLDLATNQFVSPQATVVQRKLFTSDTLRSQLMNKDVAANTLVYTKFIQVDDENILMSRGLRLNLYSMPAGVLGVEYFKTKASRTNGFPKLLEVVYGSATLLLFRMTKKESTFIVSKLSKGKKAIIPPEYSMTILNARASHLVVKEIYSTDVRHKYVLDEMNGMPYYVIRKNAKQELVKNPSFNTAIPVSKVNWSKILKKYNITEKTPILKQVLRKHDKCRWLFDKTETPIELVEGS